MQRHNRFAAKLRKGGCRGSNLGFTLIELMIVMTIIAILIGMAAIRYDKVVQHSKEAVLKTDLRTMRDAIDNYTLEDRKSTRLNSSHSQISYAVFCLKTKKT